MGNECATCQKEETIEFRQVSLADQIRLKRESRGSKLGGMSYNASEIQNLDTKTNFDRRSKIYFPKETKSKKGRTRLKGAKAEIIQEEEGKKI